MKSLRALHVVSTEDWGYGVSDWNDVASIYEWDYVAVLGETLSPIVGYVEDGLRLRKY